MALDGITSLLTSPVPHLAGRNMAMATCFGYNNSLVSDQMFSLFFLNEQAILPKNIYNIKHTLFE